MRSRKTILILFLCFICSFAVARQETVEIPAGDSFAIVLDTSQVSVLLVEEDLSLEQVLARSHDFVLRSEQVIKDRQSYCWLRVNFHKNVDEWQRLYIYTSKNDHVKAYLLRDQEVIQDFYSGHMEPLSKRDVHTSESYGRFMLNEAGDYQIYFRLSADYHFHITSLEFKGESEFLNTLTINDLIVFSFLGVFLIMTIYSFLVYFNFRDKAYLYYALYLLSIALFYMLADGVLREFIFLENPADSYIFLAAVVIAPLFYYLFLQEFLEISELLPSWDKFFYWQRYVHLFIFVSLIVLFFLVDDLRWLSLSARIVVIIDALIGLVLNFMLTRKQHKLIKYFVYGSLILLVSALIDAIKWDVNAYEGVLTRIGLLAEILFFSLGLGKKMRLVEMAKRNVQFQLMNQLRSNKESAEKRQAELQRQVSFRTKELREQAEMLEKARDEAEDASLAKSEFLSIMSHEIRTPMNGVIGMTHLLLQEEPKPDQVENLKTLKFSAENLMMLLNDILDYNKIESGMILLETTDFSITQLIRGLGYQFKPRAAVKGIDFNIRVDPTIPEWLRGDPTRLNQILMNLISNAVKFTTNGEVSLEIEVSGTQHDDLWLTFEVRDTGIGIPEEKLPVIFDRFTQASTQTSRQFGGTGLGLAITKRLLELMSSKIILDSVVGEGSRFYFTVKLGRGEEQPFVAEDSNLEVMKKSIRGMKALIVDDNKMNRLILEKFLGKWGMTYDSVEDGLKALEIMKTARYDIILLDIQMPHMDGFEVARRIRKMEGLDSHNLPVIALSADVFSNVYNRLMESGMDDFVSKPLNPNELLEVIYKYTLRITV